MLWSSMKKKLDTRFPAVRIKKIMQTDEDVGKIAMAVPLLVSKALELFLQDLCDRTYEITLKRGAKTLNSSHLKQCVQTISTFDFLKDTVSKVQDLGGSGTVGEDHSVSVIKRRRVVGDEKNDNHVELKKARKIEAGEPTSGVQGQGRRRGRPRKRTLAGQNENTHDNLDGPKTEVGSPDSDIKDSLVDTDEWKENIQAPSRDFDLNVDLDENGELKGELRASSEAELKHGMEHEFQGWSVSEVEKMGINTMQLTGLNKTMEEDEDYDEEG